MYVSHFGLRQRPFGPSPDPAGYYPAASHEDALQLVERSLADGDGFAVLVGEPGLGKTLAAAVLLERHAERSMCVFLTNTHFHRPADLFQAILFDLGKLFAGKSEQELRLEVTETILSAYADDKQTLLVIDEAHHLSAELLEELRLIGNLETRHGKAVQVVLVAQPAIVETLKDPKLKSLAQRVTARAELHPLGLSDSADYLIHHLRLAGARPDVLLPDEPLAMLARASGGVPRLLNQLGHSALTLTCQASNGRVDAEAALEAINRLGLELPADEREPIVDLPPDIDNDTEETGWRPSMYSSQPPAPPRLMFAPGKSG